MESTPQQGNGGEGKKGRREAGYRNRAAQPGLDWAGLGWALDSDLEGCLLALQAATAADWTLPEKNYE
jgi:hypothetical protein